MPNPWIDLPNVAPFAVPADLDLILPFNEQVPVARPDLLLNLQMLPEPFQGNPKTAKVILLNANPGIAPNEPMPQPDTLFWNLTRQNLVHENTHFPFFMLNPGLNVAGQPGQTGAVWWRRKLREVLDAVPVEQVAAKLFCAELIPYHSQRFGCGALQLPSQDYTIELVRTAMGRGAIVVVMRSHRLWVNRIPELGQLLPGRFCRLKSAQSASISRRNCPLFDRVVEALR